MLNFIFIQGRLTRDPELRYTQTNIPVASFTVAVDRDRKNADGDRQTDFIDCVAWRQGAEFVDKYFSKGSMAIVVGSLQIRDWTDKDGNKRRSAEVNAQNVYFGESKRRDAQDAEPVMTHPPRSVDELARFPVVKYDPYEYDHYASVMQDIGDDDGELPF